MDVCRTCMKPHRKKRNRKVVSIFSELDGAFIANIIADCTAVEIKENDVLPSTICTDCFETVKLLAAFTTTVRDSDSRLRQMCKAEPAEDDLKDLSVTHFLEVKSEPAERIVNETGEEVQADDFEPEDDTDSEWDGSDEEEDRTVKRKRLGLKSKPKPRRRDGSPLPRTRKRYARKPRPHKVPIQSKEDLQLNEEERELFTVIEVPSGCHVCCGCLKIFDSAGELEAHRKLTHVWKMESLMKPSSKIVCDGCLHRYGSESSMQYHKKRVQLLKVVWECNKCKLRFKVAAKRREHLRLHPEDEPVALIARFKETTKQEFGWMCCALRCTESFATEQDLLTHAHAAHWIDRQKADLEAADKPEQCLVCYQRFADRRKIVTHQRRKYKRENFQCALCGLKFSTRSQLNSHEVKEHGSKAFQCKICARNFTDKSSMKSHLKNMHTDEKPYQCTVCGMTFRQKGNLTIHMSNHVVDPQFKCEVCFKMFKAKLHLKYHMRTHTGEKPYKCRVCGHAFANHTNCRRHEMTHTGEKPHKCSYCEKSFSLKRMLIEHESTHTGEPVVKCKICNQRFGQQSELDSHMETIHTVCEDGDSYSVENSEEQPIAQPQYIQIVQQEPAQRAPNVTAHTSSLTIQPATVAIYNVIPSTAGKYGYVLKL